MKFWGEQTKIVIPQDDRFLINKVKVGQRLWMRVIDKPNKIPSAWCKVIDVDKKQGFIKAKREDGNTYMFKFDRYGCYYEKQDEGEVTCQLYLEKP